jgi:predicted transcriptional regulator of viral defense system
MALLTYKEALNKYGSRSAISSNLDSGDLFAIKRNLYSTKNHPSQFEIITKRYPQAIVTGQTAFYIYGFTDKIPMQIDLATKRNGTRITDPDVKQHFVDNKLFKLGSTTAEFDGTIIAIYDLEMTLHHLMHNANKIPFDLYKEVLKGYRSRAEELDYSKLQRYAKKLAGGRKNLDKIIKEVI